ncbi:MAG: protein phosphatase 2C domain-containing protein [Candidatus Kariarchaeaceae archaeon]
MTKEAIMLGSSFNEVGVIGTRIINNNEVALTISPGKTVNDKSIRINEDSIGAYVDDINHLTLVVVADSHFGGLSADALILSFIKQYNAAKLAEIFSHELSSEIVKQLKEYIAAEVTAAQTEILDGLKRKEEPVGDTTLLVTIKHKNYLYWFSVGDSIIYIFHGSSFHRVNTPQFEYLSNDTPGLADVNLNFGVNKLEEESIILISTNGLIRCIDKQVPLEGIDLLDSIVYSDPEKSAENLIRMAFDLGANENLGFVVFSS